MALGVAGTAHPTEDGLHVAHISLHALYLAHERLDLLTQLVIL